MNRGVTEIVRAANQQLQDDYIPGTPKSRIALVWPLTREVATLDKKYDVHRKLQRDRVVLIRGKTLEH